MKKIVKTLIFVFLFFFGVIIKVNAEYAYCFYGISPNDNDLKIKTGTFKKEKASVVLEIAYNSEIDDLKSPKLVGRYIPTSEADFSDGYEKEWSKDITHEPIDCPGYDAPCFYDLPPANINNLRDNEGKLACPDMYLYEYIVDSMEGRNNGGEDSINWIISFSKDEKPDVEKSYSGWHYYERHIMNPDPNYSKVSNSSNDKSDSTPSKEIATTCKYKYENYVDTAFINGSGEIQFSILKDGTVDEITNFSGQVLGNHELVYEGSKIESLECPTYLKFKSASFEKKVTISIGDKDNYDAIYNGAISTTDDNKLSFKYTSLKNSEKTISITVVNNAFKASFDGEDITITNMDLINSTTPPKFIIYKDGQYTFTDTIDKSGSDLFASSVAYTGLKALTSKEIEATCNALFGGGEGGFMTFLKENVFKIIYIVVPIILLVLTTIDFSKVVFNDDKDGIKNAWKRFGKRAIAAILIYLTPTILIFIADVIGANDVNSCIKAIRNYSESDN